MNLSSLHTHTKFCDGHDDIETLCCTAYEKGLSSIGFSSHAPIYKKTGFTSDWHIKVDAIDTYLAEVRDAQRRWAGKLRVYLGMEVDFIQGLTGPADRDYREMGLDYIIGAVHYLIPPRGAPFTVDGPAEEFEQGMGEGFLGDSKALVQAYFDAEEEMIHAGGFDILAHPDLVKKNNAKEKWFSLEDSAFLRRFGGIASLCSACGLVVELNTGGLNRGKTQELYPGPHFLQYFRAARVPVLITADAHQASDLDGNYGTALGALRDAGYTETVLFDGKSGGIPRWAYEPLENFRCKAER
ncbi:MAG: histidinol-phosphatase [Treponema sp.]|jgi:histidinol-phosphatase (PHP family)|nr:histidinol-phosphatase [Treponema sp.]